MSETNLCLWDPVVQYPILPLEEVPKQIVSAFPSLFCSGCPGSAAPATSTLTQRPGEPPRTVFHGGASGVKAVYCASLGVEVHPTRFEGGMRDQASLVVVVVTRSHLVVGCLDTKCLVHVVPLPHLVSVTTERIRVPLFTDGDSLGGSVYDGAESAASGRRGRGASTAGGMSIQTSPTSGERYLSSAGFEYTTSNGTAAALLQFPAAVDFDNLIASLQAVCSLANESLAWTHISVEDPDSGEDEDVLKPSRNERAVPGTLRDRLSLSLRAEGCTLPPTPLIPWLSIDRVAAMRVGPLTAAATALTRSAVKSRGAVRNQRRGASEAPDPLQQAQQQLAEVEAEVRRGLQSLRRDLGSSLQYVQEDLTRHIIEERLFTVQGMVGEEDRKERGVIRPLQSELEDVTKLLILRRRELDDTQGAAHQELGQWAQLDGDCRRIELQRFQAATETKESNMAMLNRLTHQNRQLQEEADQLRLAIEEYTGPHYQQLEVRASELEAHIEAENRTQRTLAAEQASLVAKVGRLADEEQATLSALKRIRREVGAGVESLRKQLWAVEGAVDQLEHGPLGESQEVLATLESHMRSAKSAEHHLKLEIEALDSRRRMLLERVDEENRSVSTGPSSPPTPAYPGRPTAFITRRPRVGESDALSPFGRGVNRWGPSVRKQAQSVSGSPVAVEPALSCSFSLSPSTNRQFYVERSRADQAAAYRDATEMDAQTRLQTRLKAVRDDLSRSIARR